MATWVDPEVYKLIEIWSEDSIQAQLEGCRRNKEVYEKISRELKDAGYERTAEQCREKVKKLKGEYRKVKDKHNKTGTGRKAWKFLNAMDDVIGDKPTTKPPVVIDTLEDNTEAVSTEQEEVEEEITEKEKDNADCSSSDPTEAEPYGSSSDKHSVCNSTSRSATPNPEEKKPRKRSLRDDKIEKMMGSVVDKLLKAQESSDLKYLELEEKRMRMEERMSEREERQKREEREFQLKLFSIMMGKPGSNDQNQLPYDGTSTSFSYMYNFNENSSNM